MAVDLAAPPGRRGPRPATNRAELGHDQLDQFSPPHIRAVLIARIQQLPGVFTGPSQVSETASLALRLREPRGPRSAFLTGTPDEFGHVHRAGFMHLMLPPAVLHALDRAGWLELHPITRRPEFPDNCVMFYAPRDESELDVAVAAVRASWAQAAGTKESSSTCVQ